MSGLENIKAKLKETFTTLITQAPREDICAHLEQNEKMRELLKKYIAETHLHPTILQDTNNLIKTVYVISFLQKDLSEQDYLTWLNNQVDFKENQDLLKTALKIQLFLAAQNYSCPIKINTLIQLNKDDINSTLNNMSLLKVACLSGNVDFMTQLLELPNIDFRASNSFGNTIFHCAMHIENPAVCALMVKLLLDHAIEKKLLYDDEGDCFADLQNKDPLSALFPIARLSPITPKDLATPLMFCCLRDKEEKTQENDFAEAASLLVPYADLTKENAEGKTLFDLATPEFLIRVAAYLIGSHDTLNLTEAKALIIRTNIKAYPLHLSALLGDKDLVDFFLKQQPNYINEKDAKGAIPLFYAIAKGHIDLAYDLIEKGADISNVNNDGATILHVAAKLGNLNLLQYLFTKKDLSTEMNSENILRETPLKYAALYSQADVINFILEKGARRETHRLFQFLVMRPNVEQAIKIATFLLENKTDVIDINGIDERGWSALHYSVRLKNHEMAAFLLEHGAVSEKTSNDDVTPFELLTPIDLEIFITRMLEKLKLPVYQATYVFYRAILLHKLNLSLNSPLKILETFSTLSPLDWSAFLSECLYIQDIRSYLLESSEYYSSFPKLIAPHIESIAPDQRRSCFPLFPPTLMYQTIQQMPPNLKFDIVTEVHDSSSIANTLAQIGTSFNALRNATNSGSSEEEISDLRAGIEKNIDDFLQNTSPTNLAIAASFPALRPALLKCLPSCQIPSSEIRAIISQISGQAFCDVVKQTTKPSLQIELIKTARLDQKIHLLNSTATLLSFNIYKLKQKVATMLASTVSELQEKEADPLLREWFELLDVDANKPPSPTITEFHAVLLEAKQQLEVGVQRLKRMEEAFNFGESSEWTRKLLEARRRNDTKNLETLPTSVKLLEAHVNEIELKLKPLKPEIPAEYICSISLDLMKDPVTVACCKQNFDRENILEHLKSFRLPGISACCPLCNKAVKEEDLQSNEELKAQIENFIQNHNL